MNTKTEKNYTTEDLLHLMREKNKNSYAFIAGFLQAMIDRELQHGNTRLQERLNKSYVYLSTKEGMASV